MVRVARTRGPEKLNFVRNPAPGSVLAALAGGRAEAEFDFINDSPEVAAFELAVDGLSPEWLGGVGPQSGAMAAASGGGSLRLIVVPPPTASVGQYDFSVRILSGGDAIAPASSLVLQVEPAAEVSPLVAATSAPLTLPPEPATGAAVVFAPEPTPITDLPLREATRAERTPTPRRRPPTAQTPPIEPSPFQPSTNGKMPLEPPTPDLIPVFTASPLVRFEAPLPAPRPMPEQTPPSTPVPRPRPAAPPEEEPVLVEHKAAPARALPAEEEIRPEVEAALVDLADGGAVALRPGETRLLRFTFTNETTRETTYVLDEDQSLPGDWITLVQDQVNLMRSGKGDVSLRLSPPLNAEPGDYPFCVTLGPQGGMLTPRALTLTVQATPAVKLTSKESVVRIGPMASFADFHLSIESAGNADTAFRVAVIPSQVASDGEVRDTKPVYDTPQWQYLFDKELETLRAPASRQAPRPIPIRLRLQRKGPWWFGFRETHHVRVAAVPVTDPANGGKPVNTVEVTATRLRFWPMPYLTLVPLFVLMLMLGSGGASSLQVSNAKHFGDIYYVLQADGVKEDATKPAVPMSAKLDWDAPFYAPLVLKATTDNKTESVGFVHGQHTDQYSVTEYGQERTYSVSRLLVAGDTSVTARFVPARTDRKLQLSSSVSDKKLSVLEMKTGSDAEATTTVTIPRNRTSQNRTLRLNLLNTTPSFKGLRIDVWLAQIPDDFEVQNVTKTNNNPIAPGGMITAQITAKPSATGASDEELILVTTDAGHQVLHVHLKVK